MFVRSCWADSCEAVLRAAAHRGCGLVISADAVLRGDRHEADEGHFCAGIVVVCSADVEVFFRAVLPVRQAFGCGEVCNFSWCIVHGCFEIAHS